MSTPTASSPKPSNAWSAPASCVHLARTRLAYGEWLRRVKRQTRRPQAAQHGHTRCSPEWVRRVSRNGLGGNWSPLVRRCASSRSTSGDELTAQEAQIARLGRRRPDESGDRCAAVHQHAHRRMASAEGLRQARHHLAQAAAHCVVGKLGARSLIRRACRGCYLTHPSRNIKWDTGNGFAFDTAGSGPHQVDIERFVEMRVVGTIVAAARLAPFQCCLERGPRRDGAGFEVECVGEVVEPGDVRVHAKMRSAALRSPRARSGRVSSPASSRTTPACSVMALRSARWRKRTFSGPSVAKISSISPRAAETAAWERCWALSRAE